MIKRKRTNTDLQNITQKTKDRVTRTLTKIRGWTQVLRKGNPVPVPLVAPVVSLEASKSKDPNRIDKIGRGYLYLIDIDLNFDKKIFFTLFMNCRFRTKIYLINHVSAETLTTGRMISSVTHSPRAEESTQW
jgi:hypothetical protein